MQFTNERKDFPGGSVDQSTPTYSSDTCSMILTPYAMKLFTFMHTRGHMNHCCTTETAAILQRGWLKTDHALYNRITSPTAEVTVYRTRPGRKSGYDRKWQRAGQGKARQGKGYCYGRNGVNHLVRLGK